MKYFKPVIAVLALTFISCTKNVNSPELGEDTGLEINTYKEGGDIKYVVYCEGSCPSGSCSDIKDKVNKKFYCSCESDNCYMIVEIYNNTNDMIASYQDSAAINLIDQMTTGKELFFDYLSTYIFETHNDGVFGITKAEFVFEDDNHVIKYSYKTLSGIENSVIFIDSYIEEKKYRVKCNGHCDTTTDKCIEEFGFGGASIHCSCQSDNCYMEVTILEP